jgi:predicted nucleic acid-binding protein
MKLIDTSSWIEQLRRGGEPLVRARVEELLARGEAAWCPIVRLELWNGARGEAESRVLRAMEAEIPSLEITAVVWDAAVRLTATARARGVTVPASDLLVAACARHHGIPVEHADKHFDLIATL